MAVLYFTGEGTWPQVGSLTLAARGPASPSSPFTSFKLGYGSGFQVPYAHKAVYVLPDRN